MGGYKNTRCAWCGRGFTWRPDEAKCCPSCRAAGKLFTLPPVPSLLVPFILLLVFLTLIALPILAHLLL